MLPRIILTVPRRRSGFLDMAIDVVRVAALLWLLWCWF